MPGCMNGERRGIGHYFIGDEGSPAKPQDVDQSMRSDETPSGASATCISVERQDSGSDDDGDFISGKHLVLVGSGGGVNRAVAAATHRHAEWDRQLDSVDQKQAELLTMQWKMIREQVGSLGHELALVSTEVRDLRAELRKGSTEVERHFRDTDSKLAEERAHRVATSEAFDQSLERCRGDLATEAKQRTNGERDVNAKLAVLTDQIEQGAADRQAMQDDLGQLRKMIEDVAVQFETLRDVLAQETEQRCAAEASALDGFKELQQMLYDESQDRASADDEISRTLKDTIDDDRTSQNQSQAALRNQISSLHKDLATHKQELPVLRTRIEETESMMEQQVKESQRALEREGGERASESARLEKRFVEITSLVQQETGARSALAEETEQMLKTCRTKLRAMVSEQAEASRLAREQFQRVIEDRLDKECAMREAQDESLLSQLAGHRTAHEMRFESISKSVREIEHKSREGFNSEAGDAFSGQSKVLEDLAKQVRDMRDTLQNRLSEERAAREAADSSIEEHVESIDRIVQDVRELFVTKSTWRRTTTRKALERRENSLGALTRFPRDRELPSTPPG